jgi:hypothetical protein
MKKLYIITIIFLLAVTASAQTVDDACLFSQTYYQGTAKALGMGNAMGAVGGDMTAVCINPASMGVYRSSEVTASINLLDNYNKSTYYGTQNSGNKVRFSLPNVGYVHAKEKSNFRALRYAQFGVGFTRTNDFNVHTNAMGINPNSSKVDDYLAQIDGYAVSESAASEWKDAFPYTIYPAWSTYLIDIYQDQSGQPYYDSPVPPGNIWQGQECDYIGRSEAWTFAGSFNFYDRLFIGISADLAHIKRVGNKTLKESSTESTTTGFNQWSFDEDLRSIGWGGNVKAGFIFHATQWLRIGGAFHSPTIYRFSETWQTTTEAEIDLVMNKYISPESHYEYNFFTPLKCVGSLAFVIGQQGMVSIDAEYTNYGAARFKAIPSDDFDYDPTNESIKSTLGRTLNLRLGSEWRVGRTYLRFGAAYYGSPFGLGQPGGSVKKASCGVSVPLSASTSLDFAYELSHGKTFVTLYNVDDIESITHSQFRNILLITFKGRF